MSLDFLEDDIREQYVTTGGVWNPRRIPGNGEAGDARMRSEAPADEDGGDLNVPVDEQEAPTGLPLPCALAAKSVLAAGLAEVDRTRRLVFLHSGASW
jgi:hypothetical protein